MAYICPLGYRREVLYTFNAGKTWALICEYFNICLRFVCLCMYMCMGVCVCVCVCVCARYLNIISKVREILSKSSDLSGGK